MADHNGAKFKTSLAEASSPAAPPASSSRKRIPACSKAELDPHQRRDIGTNCRQMDFQSSIDRSLVLAADLP